MGQIHNLLTFSGQPMGSEEVPTQMVEVLVLLYMDVLKEDPVKGKLNYRKIGFVPI